MKYKYLDEEKQHLHTLDSKPLIGCSTAVGIISKPLTYWASGMAVTTLGWTATKSDPEMRLEVATVALQTIKGLEPKDWLKRLDLAYRAHASNLKQTAVAGTDLHAELEKYVKECIARGGEPLDVVSELETKAVVSFAAWSKENIQKFLYSEAHCYSERHWTGGIFDALAILKDGKIALFDFKSSKDAYYSQFVQAGGYAVMVHENGVLDKDGNKFGNIGALKSKKAKGIRAFLQFLKKEKYKTVKTGHKIEVLYVVPFGGDCIPKPRYDVEDMGKHFISAVELYKGQNNFAPQ